jgi:glucokinase
MNIGSGIGGALILDGRLHNGQGLGAGEIGHTLVADWTRPGPGAVDRLEHLCSGWRIEQRLRADAAAAQSPALRALSGGNPATLTCAHLAEAARSGDPFALAEIGRVAESLGQALANVVTLFHPERIAIGGGVGLMGEVLLAPLRAAVDRHAFGPFRDRYEIVACELEEAVVLAGALLLCDNAPD